MSLVRTRWAAFGAAVAITLGAGGIGMVSATVTSGDRTVYVPITPCRIADTRPAYAVGSKTSPLGPAETYTINARGPQGQCNLPSDAVGLALNVTAANATIASFLTFWGDGAQPNAANLNPQPGQPPTPNAVTTDLTDAGTFKVFNNKGTVDIIIDVNGYYADHNHDDRYYTKEQVYTRAQVDELLRGAPLGRVMARGVVFGNNPPNFSSDTFALDGLTLNISEIAAGRYQLQMSGGGLTDFATVQVLPFDFGGGRRTCSLATTSLSGGDYDASVNCYDAAGALTRTSFEFLIVGAPA